MIIYKRSNPRIAAEQKGQGMDREDRHVRLYSGVYARPVLVRGLRILDKVAVALIGAAFAYALIVLLWAGEYPSLFKLLAFSAVPFIAVSLMRSLINCKRPYEVYDCEALREMSVGRKKGHSFPSRHVFSAFLIGTLWLMYSPYVGCAVLVLGVFLAFERALLGIHFARDVLAGAVIGIVSGLVGVLIW